MAALNVSTGTAESVKGRWDLVRTNNAVESWYTHFSRCVRIAHPNQRIQKLNEEHAAKQITPEQLLMSARHIMHYFS